MAKILNTIAILIPCYNSALYLPELFKGIYAQTIPFDEIICYDDCSTDNTIEVAEKLGAKVIKGKINGGAAFARNRLIEATSCTYIHFHDSDDLIDYKFVETIKSYIQHENVALLCNTYVFDREDRKKNLGNIIYNRLNEYPDQLNFFIENIGFASMGLYSKSVLIDIGGFREDLKGNEDPDLHIRLSEKGYIIKSIDHFLVTKLEHYNSFSHQNWFQCLADKFKCLVAYAERFDKKYHPILGKQAAELSNYFYREGDLNLSKKAENLALSLGLKIMDGSKFSYLISKYLGLRSYLWLYRRRVDLKLI